MKHNRERLIKLALLTERAAAAVREMGRAAGLLRVEVPGYAQAAARAAQIVAEATGAETVPPEDDGSR
jgi:hypothetical protein